MSNKIKIKKGLKMPADGRGRHRKYPIDEMEVGDAFILEANDTVDLRVLCKKAQVISSTANRRKAPKRFAARRIPGTLSVGVWRVE